MGLARTSRDTLRIIYQQSRQDTSRTLEAICIGSLQHDSNLPSDDDFLHAWEIDDCFSDILERAKQHAEHCLEKHQGKMNYNIIVQLKQRTIDAGFLQHKSFTAFKRRYKN